jgi:hypothetical protein
MIYIPRLSPDDKKFPEKLKDIELSGYAQNRLNAAIEEIDKIVEAVISMEQFEKERDL